MGSFSRGRTHLLEEDGVVVGDAGGEGVEGSRKGGAGALDGGEVAVHADGDGGGAPALRGGV